MQFIHYLGKWDVYKDFINRTCQGVRVDNSTDNLQNVRAYDCYLLSVNENLCLSDGVEKFVGWNPLMWNGWQNSGYSVLFNVKMHIRGSGLFLLDYFKKFNKRTCREISF